MASQFRPLPVAGSPSLHHRAQQGVPVVDQTAATSVLVAAQADPAVLVPVLAVPAADQAAAPVRLPVAVVLPVVVVPLVVVVQTVPVLVARLVAVETAKSWCRWTYRPTPQRVPLSPMA